MLCDLADIPSACSLSSSLVVPGGPALLWLPANIWLYKQDATGWAIFLALWGLLMGGTADPEPGWRPALPGGGHWGRTDAMDI